MKETTPSRRIHLLRDSVSRLIAAGEVIERPSSVVRELLDNSLDAGSENIEVYLAGGGISGIRVVDNGGGMESDDLAVCFQAHTTSKISELGDLDTLQSLGFRGEALSSIAACSKMTITSSTGTGTPHAVTLHGGSVVTSGPAAGNRGTIVEVSDLFYSMPPRRKFLKRPASETGLCTKSFIEKASAFPETAFKLVIDGKTKYTLPRTDLKDRLESIYGKGYALQLITGDFEGFSLTLAAGDPAVRQRDRRLLQVFVNRRRVYEYALLQALEYGYSSFTPGGYHPVCFLFVDIDPALVDFNIHPAKREVRFRNLPDIHRAVTATLQRELGTFLSNGTEREPIPDLFERRPDFQGPASFNPARSDHFRPSPTPPPGKRTADFIAAWSDLRPMKTAPPPGRNFRYIGSAFGVFLLAEMNDELLFIDQHAAHEKILYNRLSGGQAPRQELLVPFAFETDEDNDRRIDSLKDDLHRAGIDLERVSSGVWHILAVPAGFLEYEGVIGDFLTSLHGTVQNLEEGLYAAVACKAAIKEGSSIDPVTACELIDQVLSMEHPRCPHGRPIIFRLSRDHLYRRVQRT